MLPSSNWPRIVDFQSADTGSFPVGSTKMKLEIIIEQKPGEWAIATCKQIPGLFISHPDLEKVIEDIPVTIKILKSLRR